MTVKEKIQRLLNYKPFSNNSGAYMTQLEPLELQQQPYNNSSDGTPDDVVALFGMNAIESSSDLCRRIMAIDNPSQRGRLAVYVWRLLDNTIV